MFRKYRCDKIFIGILFRNKQIDIVWKKTYKTINQQYENMNIFNE